MGNSAAPRTPIAVLKPDVNDEAHVFTRILLAIPPAKAHWVPRVSYEPNFGLRLLSPETYPIALARRAHRTDRAKTVRLQGCGHGIAPPSPRRHRPGTSHRKPGGPIGRLRGGDWGVRIGMVTFGYSGVSCLDAMAQSAARSGGRARPFQPAKQKSSANRATVTAAAVPPHGCGQSECVYISMGLWLVRP